MTFATAITCMDGRAQMPVFDFVSTYYKVDYVDMVTEPGPNRILAEGVDAQRLMTIFERVRISLECHDSQGMAVTGHADCAGNPVSESEQTVHTQQAVQAIRLRYPDVPVIGLWVATTGHVRQLA